MSLRSQSTRVRRSARGSAFRASSPLLPADVPEPEPTSPEGANAPASPFARSPSREMPRGILRDIGLDESEEDSDVTLAVPDFAAAAEQNAVAQDVTFDVACSPDDSSPPPRPSPTSPLIAAFNGVNFDILPDVETLQSDVFTSEQIRELCGKVDGLRLIGPRASLIRRLEACRNIHSSLSRHPTVQNLPPLVSEPGHPVPNLSVVPMGDVPANLGARAGVGEGTATSRPAAAGAAFYSQAPQAAGRAAQSTPSPTPSFPPGFTPPRLRDPSHGGSAPAAVVAPPPSAGPAPTIFTGLNSSGGLQQPQAMPDPQHATIPAAFDIQTYVDSVLQKSMQEETKGVSNWLKAHRLRSELLEWCLAPGKAVSEVSKTMR
ncbi:hypothetical protein CYMTET_22406 [Cymbomonas tetramitiformis]|uniref:Uncharacterized protein n=1 Tax=Cymbomonas tetramitiformis TaxID=36881 RepID=A0AAE0FZZ0_9CHLO|nr:hypothetical protein CYMTET_22406 [Cymbomonas tetramitiformis]